MFFKSRDFTFIYRKWVVSTINQHHHCRTILNNYNNKQWQHCTHNGFLCRFCNLKNSDFELLCGHHYHEQCAIELFMQKQQCFCGYQFSTDIEPILFHEEQQCPICFEDCGTDIKRPKCGHLMHVTCYQELCSFSDKCPVCRRKLE